MFRSVRGPAFVLALLAPLVLLSAAPATAATPSQVARVLAGLPVEDSEVTAALPARALARYTAHVDEWWASFDERIGAPMTSWALEALAQTDGTVFYPFAGADFPTVHRLYPSAARYVLIALEPGGRMPQLTSEEDAEAILEVFSTMMEDFHRRGYFITGELLDQFSRSRNPLEGVTAVLAMSAEREGFEVGSLVALRLADDGSDVVPREADLDEPGAWSSVRLELTRRSDGAAVLLDYVRLDLSDENLSANPAEAAFVTALSANPVVVKSASHLLQYESFSVIRGAILAQAPTVVQDESGIEYDALARVFEVQLFGNYEHPNSDFAQNLNPSLVRAYDEQEAERLPFRYGYWKDGLWCLQYAHTRREAAAGEQLGTGVR